MNKRILYISLFLLLAASFGSRAQEYIPMLKEGNQWNVLYSKYSEWGSDYMKTYIYQLGDNIEIEGTEYVVLQRSSNSTGGGFYTYGYIREEVESQKVYFRGDLETEEGLIYDFDVEVGDTIVTINPKCYSQSNTFRTLSIVENIDFIEVEGEKHRRITIIPYYYFLNELTNEWEIIKEMGQTMYIEGIGADDGLLSEFISGVGGASATLRAFKQNGEVIYNPFNFENDFYWDENISSSLIVERSDNFHITLSSDQLVIRNEQEAEYDIALYTPTGRLILTQRSGGREEVVNLSSLPAGVYLLRVSGERGEVTKKIQVVK